MLIHTVRQGETLFSVSLMYGAPFSLVAVWNGIAEPYRLAVGQNLLILSVKSTYTVRQGDTVFGIAQNTGIDEVTLYRYNPNLGGGAAGLYAGQTLVTAFDEYPSYAMSVNAYAYPFINNFILTQTLPYLTYLTPFTYGITESGSLVPLDDTALIASAYSYGVSPLMHLSTLSESGNFSTSLALSILDDKEKSRALIARIIGVMNERGYAGLDIDFEYLPGAYAARYAEFVSDAREALSPYGYPVTVALAPKTYTSQPGLLYEGHDYAALGAAADYVLLMTYEWGYTYGPPMAVAPLPNVRRVLDYAVTQIPPGKIYLGIPNYGYDWLLPYRKNGAAAVSLSNQRAVSIAVENGSEIHFDAEAQSPFFNYVRDGAEHEVWFEDAKSIIAKLSLISEYGLYGAGYWNAMRPFNANWMITATQFDVRE